MEVMGLKKLYIALILGLTFSLSTVGVFADNTNVSAKDVKSSNTLNFNVKTPKIDGKDYDENSGADAYANGGDNANSKFYKAPDIYNMVSDNQTIVIPKYKTMQQTTEWSCGNAMALMVLEHFGIKGHTEMSLAEAMGTSVDLDVKGAKPGSANNFFEYGTDVEQLYNFFSNLKDVKVVETNYKPNAKAEDLTKKSDGISDADVGNIKPVFVSESLYTSENKAGSTKYVSDAKDSYFVKWLTGHLKAGRPIMVEWSQWDGHWVAIIGYDNNGTPSIGGDTLIFADSYDTFDHYQDGYSYYGLERFFYEWNDRKVAKKPLQLQPYIIVDKVNKNTNVVNVDKVEKVTEKK